MNLRKEWLIPSGVGVLSFALGAVAGYVYSQRRGREVITVVKGFEDETDPDIIELVENEQLEMTLGPEGAVHEFRDPIAEQTAIFQTVADERTAVELEHIRETQDKTGGKFNVFEGPEDAWDYAEELAKRTPDKPYIIHVDEFEENEPNNSQSTLTYYAGDDVLCDEADTPIYDYHNTVGVLEFGKGSRDISIVYVRNEKLDASWEIIIDHGSFQAEVLGAEIEHSYERRDLKQSVRKFREED